MTGPAGGREFDVVGMGLNAVDHLCVVPRFPKYEEKLRMEEFRRAGGGQVASAMVACARWGLKARYRGKVGGGDLGAFSLSTLREAGVDVSDVAVVEGVLNQFAFILIDKMTGERTIIWTRDDRLKMLPEEVPLGSIATGRFLHLDGHDAPAAAHAARGARRLGVKVVLDAETVKDGTREMVASADYVVASSEFPERFTGDADRRRALAKIKDGGAVCVVSTLGKMGSVCLYEGRYIETRGFRVECVDSTGAGDVFHAAFVYGLAGDWEMEKILEFSNAAAALNCTDIGARAGIKPPGEIFDLMKGGDRW
jgi:sugar/nucleoside kinase (ribokinase family)